MSINEPISAPDNRRLAHQLEIEERGNIAWFRTSWSMEGQPKPASELAIQCLKNWEARGGGQPGRKPVGAQRKPRYGRWKNKEAA